MVIAYSYIFLLEHFEGPIYALMDIGYFAVSRIYLLIEPYSQIIHIHKKSNRETKLNLQVHVLNCAYASTFLMKNHKSLRKAAFKLLPRKRFFTYIFPGRTIPLRTLQAPTMPLGSRISETTNQYFEMLEDSWK